MRKNLRATRALENLERVFRARGIIYGESGPQSLAELD